MFVACGIWCLADVSSVSPSSEQTPESKTRASWFQMKPLLHVRFQLEDTYIKILNLLY